MSMFKRVNLYLYKKNVRPLFWSDNFLKFRCTLYCELHTAWFYVDMASVYERALTEKNKSRHPFDKSLSYLCGCWLWWTACVEPLPQFEWFFGESGVRCLFNSYWVGEAFHIFADDVLYQWCEDKYLDKCGQKKRTDKNILGRGQITMLDSNLGFFSFYLKALMHIHMCDKYLSCGKGVHHPKYIFLCTLYIGALRGLSWVFLVASLYL